MPNFYKVFLVNTVRSHRVDYMKELAYAEDISFFYQLWERNIPYLKVCSAL